VKRFVIMFVFLCYVHMIKVIGNNEVCVIMHVQKKLIMSSVKMLTLDVL